VPVERGGLVVFGVNGECANANHIGDLKRSSQRVEQQPGTDAAPLRFGMNGKAGQHQQRNRIARHALDDALGGLGVTNLAGDDRIETDNLVTGHGNVGLRRICLLGAQRVADEETIKLGPPASEVLDGVGTIELLDAKQIRHGLLFGSNTDRSPNRRSRRG